MKQPFSRVALASVTLCISVSAAAAGHDMTFRDPSTWRKVWSDQNVCDADLGGGCVALGPKGSYCGISMFSSTSTRDSAVSMWSRGETVKIKTPSGTEICDITP